MGNHLLRRALLCVAATYGALLACSAEASHTVTIGPGDSLDSLARKYHVAKRDIAQANSISPEALLIDGRKLVIPDPPRTVSHGATMRRPAQIKGDRITIRRGPNEGYRRLTLLDHAAPIVVTARAGDWSQVELPGGKSGWVRSDYVSARGAAADAPHPAPQRVARRSDERQATRSRRSHDDGESASDRRAARRRRAQQEARAEARRERLAEERAAARRRQRLAQRHHTRSTRVASSHTRHRGRPEASAPAADGDVVRTAYTYRGTPYHFGGSSRGGFDCSGFTSYVYRRKGVSLPHSAAGQYHEGKRISRGDMKPGDLVFFHTTRGGISHVGIYAGSGKFVHASSGGGRVRVDSLDSGYYKSRFRGARRVK